MSSDSDSIRVRVVDPKRALEDSRARRLGAPMPDAPTSKPAMASKAVALVETTDETTDALADEKAEDDTANDAVGSTGERGEGFRRIALFDRAAADADAAGSDTLFSDLGRDKSLSPLLSLLAQLPVEDVNPDLKQTVLSRLDDRFARIRKQLGGIA